MLKYRFDIENGEVARVTLLSLSSTSHFLIFGMHHIAYDGFSVNLLLTRISVLFMKARNLRLFDGNYQILPYSKETRLKTDR